jgi:HEAT repeat protein
MLGGRILRSHEELLSRELDRVEEIAARVEGGDIGELKRLQWFLSPHELLEEWTGRLEGALLSALDSADFDLAKEAALCAKGSECPPIREKLKAIATSHSSDEVRGAANAALEGSNATDVTHILVNSLTAESLPVRLGALHGATGTKDRVLLEAVLRSSTSIDGVHEPSLQEAKDQVFKAEESEIRELMSDIALAGKPRDTAALIDVLKGADTDLSYAAAIALGPDSGIDALRAFLELPYSVPGCAYKYGAECLHKADADVKRDFLIETIASGQSELSARAISALRGDTDPRSVAAVTPKLKSDDSSVREIAATTLASSGTKEALQAIAAYVNDRSNSPRQRMFILAAMPDEGLSLVKEGVLEGFRNVRDEWHSEQFRARCAGSLGVGTPPEDVALLKKYVSSEISRLATGAIRSLARIGGAENLAAISKGLCREDEKVIEAAIDALLRVGGEQLAGQLALERLSESTDSVWRIGALKCLLRCPTVRPTQQVNACMDDESPQVQILAATLMLREGNVSGVNRLAGAIGHDTPEIDKGVIEACHNCDNEEVIQRLLSCFHHESPEVASGCADALRTITNPALFVRLIDGTESMDKVFAARCFRALAGAFW